MSTTPDRDPVAAVIAATGVGLAGVLAGLVSVTLALSLVDAVVALPDATPERVTVLMLAQYTGIAAVAAFYLSASDRSVAFLRIERPTLRHVAWMVVGVVALFAALTAATAVIERLGLATTEHSILALAEENPAVLLPLVPLSILLTGPVEELLYRGVVQTRLTAAFDTAPAVLVAAVVFAVVHLPAYGLGDSGGSLAATIVVLFLLGGLLGALYERTGNLVVPALVHGVYNAITFGSKYLELTGVA